MLCPSLRKVPLFSHYFRPPHMRMYPRARAHWKERASVSSSGQGRCDFESLLLQKSFSFWGVESICLAEPDIIPCETSLRGSLVYLPILTTLLRPALRRSVAKQARAAPEQVASASPQRLPFCAAFGPLDMGQTVVGGCWRRRGLPIFN